MRVCADLESSYISKNSIFCLSALSTCSKVSASKEAVISDAIALARTIASKSPVAVQGSKINLNYSRDHSVLESLQYMVSSFARIALTTACALDAFSSLRL